MKRFWISLLLLAVVFFTAQVNSWYLGLLTDELAQGLRAAQASAEAGDWETAQALTSQVQDTWEAASGYVYVVLRHSDSDEVHSGLLEVAQLLRWQEEAEYTSANARLISNIQLLSEMEVFNLKNLL